MTGVRWVSRRRAREGRTQDVSLHRSYYTRVHFRASRSDAPGSTEGDEGPNPVSRKGNLVLVFESQEKKLLLFSKPFSFSPVLTSHTLSRHLHPHSIDAPR